MKEVVGYKETIVGHIRKISPTFKRSDYIDHNHCPPKDSPCGFEGKHRYCLCLEEKNLNQ